MNINRTHPFIHKQCRKCGAEMLNVITWILIDLYFGEWKRRNDSDMNDKMYQIAGYKYMTQ